MRRCFLLLLILAPLLCAVSVPLRAQDSPWSPPGAQPPPNRVVVYLRDGSQLRGVLLEETADEIVIQNATLGELRIPREQVEQILQAHLAPPPQEVPGNDPDYNSVLLGPTPETLPKGSGYFRNFELIIFNFGFAPTNDLNLSIGTLFPVSTGALYFSAGFKYRILKREKHFVGLAFAGSVSFLQDETAGTVTGILGIGNRRRSLNLSVHDLFNGDDSVGFFVVGGDYQIGSGAKLLLEYANGTAAFTDEEDFSGFINVGFRLFSSRWSFTLTGFRPLEEAGDEFILFPLAMFSRHW